MFALLWTIADPRLFPASVACNVARDFENHWRELDDEDDRLYEEVVHRLANPGSLRGPIVRPSKRVSRPFLAASKDFGSADRWSITHLPKLPT